jgi:hypothetical protein
VVALATAAATAVTRRRREGASPSAIDIVRSSFASQLSRNDQESLPTSQLQHFTEFRSGEEKGKTAVIDERGQDQSDAGCCG